MLALFQCRPAKRTTSTDLVSTKPVLEKVSYRPFLNTDPPLLVDVWRSQEPFRGFFGNLDHSMLDRHVFAKPYFDRNSLILATNSLTREQCECHGFVHASFDVDESLSDLNREIGVISQLRVRPGEHQQAIAARLLQHGIDYLTSHGAKQVYFGGRFPQTPFYLGLYGGSRLAGVMEGDALMINALTEFGFQETDRIVCLERDLASFKSIIGRQQMTIRRNYLINSIPDPMEQSWWECCTLGMAERDRFHVTTKKGNEVCGTVSYWDILPISSQWGVKARGLYDLNIVESARRTGLATFLVGESLKQMAQQGVGIVEAQAKQSNEASLKLFEKLGFNIVANSLVMHKTL
jgi:ribosomal protein S18 acetylase RimI-like enzyme